MPSRRVFVSALVAVALVAAAAGAVLWRNNADDTSAGCAPLVGELSKDAGVETLRKLAAAYADNDLDCVAALTLPEYTATEPSDALVSSLVNRRAELDPASCSYTPGVQDGVGLVSCNVGSASFNLAIRSDAGRVLATELTGTDGLIG